MELQHQPILKLLESRYALITLIAMKSNHRSRFEESVEKEEVTRKREEREGASDDRRRSGEYLARERG